MSDPLNLGLLEEEISKRAKLRLYKINLLSDSTLIESSNAKKYSHNYSDYDEEVTGRVDELPKNIAGSELCDIWPQPGFLDDGLIIIDSSTPGFRARLEKNYQSGAWMHTMMFRGNFFFLDKKNNIYGEVRFELHSPQIVASFEKLPAATIALRLAKSNFFSNLWEAEKVTCHENSCEDMQDYNFPIILEHLNDYHKYSFEQLVKWLNGINAKPKVLPVYSSNNKYLGEVFEDYRKFVRNNRNLTGVSFYRDDYSW